MDSALKPLTLYLAFFRKFEFFININNEFHVNSKITVSKRDSDSTEIELPSSVDLNQIAALLDHHLGTYVRVCVCTYVRAY